MYTHLLLFTSIILLPIMSVASSIRVAAIFGAGPGNGAAFAARFLKEGYNVAVLSRSADAMNQLAASLGSANANKNNKVCGYPCDVTSDEAVQTALEDIQKDLGPVSTIVYNAGSGGFKPIEQWTAAEITGAADINAAGLYRVAVAAKPQLLSHSSKGAAANIVVVGASAATRGRPTTVGFAAGKAAQRSVAQSLARAWGPEKIHVSYMIIDGIVDNDKVRSMFNKPPEFFVQSDDIAEAVMNVVNQKSSAWTFEFDVRPFGEVW
jgi:short-subunit dehydrogenase